MNIELEREVDGRWITEVPDLPDVMAYGQSREKAITKVEALSLCVLADRMEDQTPGRHLSPVKKCDWL
jgi:predicted RNase H-like HicB family nuclease